MREKRRRREREGEKGTDRIYEDVDRWEVEKME